jgi:hypothetical protein
MSDQPEVPWSPAHNPYAIAVSQSWWAFQAVLLFAGHARDGHGPAQQIFARQIFGQLRALHRCAEMQATELRRLGVDAVHRDQLRDEITAFDNAVPGAKNARDILEHFDGYARGKGRLQKTAIRDDGVDVDEAATMFWGGGYNPETEVLTEGPFTIVIPQAVDAARRLYLAVYQAARAIDDMRGRT